MKCIICNHELSDLGSELYCTNCSRFYKKKYSCRSCKSPLTVNKKGFYCQRCNEHYSRKQKDLENYIKLNEELTAKTIYYKKTAEQNSEYELESSRRLEKNNPQNQFNSNTEVIDIKHNDDVIVTTKEQLKEAKERGCKRIIVKGELAKNLAEAQKINTLGPIAMGVLVAALAAIPFTGGLSAVAALPIAAATGLSTTVIIAIIAVGGIVLIVALLKDYKIIIRKDEVILEKK